MGWIDRYNNSLANWPVRSPDITALDKFYWETLKTLVDCRPVNTEDELRRFIQTGIDVFEK